MSVRRVGSLALVAATLAGMPVLADFKEDYRAGVEALERGDWVAAVQRLRQAVAENPEASGLLGGGMLRRYTPHFYLGVALAELGRCREAIAELDEAERQGKAKDLETLQTKRTACRQMVSEVETAVEGAQREIDAASEAAFAVAQIEKVRVLRPVWREGSPSFAQRQGGGAADIAEARARLKQGEEKLDLEAVAEAIRLAVTAAESLTSLAADAEALRLDLEPRVQELLTTITDLTATTRKDLRFVASKLAPVPPAVKQVMSQTEEGLAWAAAASDTVPVEELEAIAADLQQRLRLLRGSVRAPPNPLMEAAEAFLRADYARTLETLADDPTDPRVLAHTCLLRAAARHGLYRVGGERDAELLKEARQDLADCRALDDPIEPVPTTFSPAFVTFWTQEMIPPQAETEPGGGFEEEQGLEPEASEPVAPPPDDS